MIWLVFWRGKLFFFKYKEKVFPVMIGLIVGSEIVQALLEVSHYFFFSNSVLLNAISPRGTMAKNCYNLIIRLDIFLSTFFSQRLSSCLLCQSQGFSWEEEQRCCLLSPSIHLLLAFSCFTHNFSSFLYFCPFKGGFVDFSSCFLYC